MANKFVNFDSFIDNQLKLIDLEHEAEKNESSKYQEQLPLLELVRRGICVHKLCIAGTKTGLYGRTVVTFEPNPITYGKDKTLPSHNISSGDIVNVFCGSFEKKDIQASGVVLGSRRSDISVAFEEDGPELSVVSDSNNFILVKIANDVTYRRLKFALNNLRQNKIPARSSNLKEVLFGERQFGEPLVSSNSINFINKNLDTSQQEAVKFALNQRELAIVHGPPGTGKTTTIIEVILQSVLNGDQKVLACAPSNIAVDNILEKLVEAKVQGLVRLGHPARASPHLQQYSLDASIMRSDQRQLVNDIRTEIDKMKKNYSTRMNVKALRKELREREQKALLEVLKGSKVVLATLTSSSEDGPLRHLLRTTNPDDQFSLLVIDECSQAMEASCWIPLMLAPKCVLAGDHLQLPPTIISEKAAKGGLSLTLMERLLASYTSHSNIVRMLTVQYRMNVDIMAWSSLNLYDNKLVAHESVSGHLLSDICPDLDLPALVLIDTAGCDMCELEVEDEESKGNECEADIVAIYVENLISGGLDPKDIGVITPYNLQVDLVRARLKAKYPTLEIKSVDGFQGREKEAIVISLVRSNDRKEVGFLAEHRRINVAVTRARRHLAIVCDSETVSSDKYIKSLLEHIEAKGDLQSGHEYNDRLGDFNHIERPEYLRFKTTTSSMNSKVKDKPRVNKAGDKTDEDKKAEQIKRNQDRKEAIRRDLVEFLKSNRTSLEFSFDLNSYERMVVHEIAGELKLLHESSGDGNERRIVVKKAVKLPPVVTSSTLVEHVDECSEQNNEWSTVLEQKPTVAVTVKAKKNKNKPKKVTQLPPVLEPKKVDKLPKLVKTDKLVKELDQATLDDDFDALIAAVQKADSTCSYVKCKTSTKILGHQCEHCRRHFCFNHSQSEVHGCGAAAKVEARKAIAREGRIYPGSGAIDHSCDPVRRVHLQRSLNKKLTKLSDQRSRKPKDGQT